MSEHQENTHNGKWYFIRGVLVATSAIFLGLAGGFWLGRLLFQYIGQPSDFWAYIVSGLLGFFLLSLVVRIVVGLVNKTKHGDTRRHVIGDTLEALNRISRGDFSVTLTVKEHDPFTDLNKSINKMARELGSMEMMRQDFISNVSHEIQSPLTSISGFAALLKNDGLPDEQRRHYVAVIEAESKRLSGLSENLLKLSALEWQDHPLSVSEFRLDKQIENVALTLEPQWSAKNIEFEVALAKTLYSGDEGLLSQVWINLLHNAIKFTPQDGQIHIQLFTEETGVTVKISDTGLGISPDDQMHIFERFYKADKARDRSLGGNGLGLSLVKKIVELHDGHITIESELRKGTVFSVFLPAKK